MLLERAWLHGKIYLSKRTRLSKEVVPLLQADSGVIGSMIDLGFDGDTKYRSTRSQMEKGTLLKCGVPVANSFPYIYICVLTFSKGITFVIEGGLWSSQTFSSLISASCLLCQLLVTRKGCTLSSTLLHPKGQKPRKNEKKKTKKEPKKNHKNICQVEVLGRAAVKPFPVRIVFFFFPLFFFLVLGRMASWKLSLSGFFLFLFFFYFLFFFVFFLFVSVLGRKASSKMWWAPFLLSFRGRCFPYCQRPTAKGAKTQLSQRCFLLESCVIQTAKPRHARIPMGCMAQVICWTPWELLVKDEQSYLEHWWGGSFYSLSEGPNVCRNVQIAKQP